MEAVLLSVFNGATVTYLRLAVEVKCVDYTETTPMGRREWHLPGRDTGKAPGGAEDILRRDRQLQLDGLQGCRRSKPQAEDTCRNRGVMWYVGRRRQLYGTHLPMPVPRPRADTDDKRRSACNLHRGMSLPSAARTPTWAGARLGFAATPRLNRWRNQLPDTRLSKPGRKGTYSCNSAERPIFDDAAFHPDRILAEYTAIFHPEVMPGYELRYFKRTRKRG